MGVKHSAPHRATEHKTHHQTGYHKRVKNPTTNYGKDTHKQFCKRCLAFNGCCPETGSVKESNKCNL